MLYDGPVEHWRPNLSAIMPTRKQDRDDGPGEDRRDEEDTAALPVRRLQTTALLDAPKKGLEVVVERGASAYFSTCRRIARFLNRGD